MSTSPIFVLGIICVLAAIGGGGLEAFGVKLPPLASRARQIAVAAFGLILIAGYFYLTKHETASAKSSLNAKENDVPKPASPSIPTSPISSTPQPSRPEPKSKEKPPAQPTARGGVQGSDNTVVGSTGLDSINGSGNTIVGPTDANGNTVIPPGTAIGRGATADKTSVAIGAGANAGQQNFQCTVGSICNQGTTVNAPQTVNNSGPPALEVSVSSVTPVSWKSSPGRYVGSITVITNTDWAPVALAIRCNVPIDDIELFGSHMMEMETPGPAFLVSWQSPAISPKSPQTIWLGASRPITACDVEKK